MWWGVSHICLTTEIGDCTPYLEQGLLTTELGEILKEINYLYEIYEILDILDISRLQTLLEVGVQSPISAGKQM